MTRQRNWKETALPSVLKPWIQRSLLFLMPLGLALAATSCGTTFMVAADDMYGNVPTREEEYEMKLRQWEAENAAAQAYEDAYYADEYLSDAAAADTFNYDDYYDYEYSSRLRRFHSDDYLSDDYYSDYYTNYYWYDPDPYYYGTSIYLGYDWWYPSYSYYYRPGWYMGFGWGGFGFGVGLGFGYGGYWGGWGWPFADESYGGDPGRWRFGFCIFFRIRCCPVECSSTEDYVCRTL